MLPLLFFPFAGMTILGIDCLKSKAFCSVTCVIVTVTAIYCGFLAYSGSVPHGFGIFCIPFIPIALMNFVGASYLE